MRGSTDLPASDASTPQAQAQAQAQARALERLREQCAVARAALQRVHAQLALAESRLDANASDLLREANERLVVSALKAGHEAELRERELGTALRTLALDPLTQVPNRLLLRDRFAQAAAGARRLGSRMAVLFVDIDRFKRINDLYGHAAGDEALCAVAQAIAGAVRASDTVCRHGGDEFVVLLGVLADTADATAIATKVADAVACVRIPGSVQMRLSASIGAAIYPDEGEDIDLLIERADAAMYRSKRAGAFLPRRHRSAESVESAASAGRARLRDVNERLVIAVLNARDSQEAAEDAFSVQRTNIAVTAHELRNPLAPISYAIRLLKSVQAREPMAVQVQNILERQLAQMTRLVNDLLDASRASTGKLQIAHAVIDLHPLIEAAAQAFLPAMQARHQTMVLDVIDQPALVRGDTVRLLQVLSNLLDNASKYTPEGGSIRLAMTGDAAQLVVTVSDNGIGISAVALPYVFDAFVQERQVAETNGEGLGIGLMLVRQLVEAHGGSAVVHSRGRDRGSEFVVTLPRVQA